MSINFLPYCEWFQKTKKIKELIINTSVDRPKLKSQTKAGGK